MTPVCARQDEIRAEERWQHNRERMISVCEEGSQRDRFSRKRS